MLWFGDRTHINTHTAALRRLLSWFEDRTPTHTHDVTETAAVVV